MATEEWICHLPVACQTLLRAQLLCQDALNTKLEEIAVEFVWLTEIADEAFKFFSVKRAKLKQMPKTPSMKQRGQKRGRQKIETVIEHENEEGSPKNTKRAAPTKLKFESPKETTSSDESVVNESSRQASNCQTAGNENGRPVRNCRVTSKPVYVDEDELPKRSTRQSRKPLNNTLSKTVDSENISAEYQDHGIKNSVVKLEVPNTNDSKDAVKTKPCTIIIAVEKSKENSPSVKDRTKAYESMLKHRSSQSPVLKLQRVEKNIVTKVNSPIKIDTNAKDLGGKLSSKDKRSQELRHSHRRSNHKSSKFVQQNSDDSEKLSTETNGTKQKRTRLRLKKQQQEQAMDVSESREPAQLEYNHLLGSNNTTVPSQCSEQNTDLQKVVSSKNNLSDSIKDAGIYAQQDPQSQRDILNETETIVTELFEMEDNGRLVKLREFEIVKTKTTPATELISRHILSVPADSGSDQGFDGDEDSVDNTSDGYDGHNKISEKVGIVGNNNLEKEVTMATRTRTRAQKKNEESDNAESEGKTSKDSGVVAEITNKADTTFVKDKMSPDSEVRVTRTKTRAQKEPVSKKSTEGTERATRTRHRKQDEASNITQNTKPTSVVPIVIHPATQESCTVTRSKLRKVNGPNKLTICGSDDEIIAGSPIVGTPKPSLRGAKKRLADERGLSPRPKRSCVGDQSSLNLQSPQKTSSPIKKKGAGLHNEADDTVPSPKRSPKPFKFNSAQKKTSGFLNRTPGFGQNTSRFYSFLSNTPTCRSTSVLTSFLKRNTPPPKQNSQLMLEQKRQKLLEKESRDMERLRKAAEFRKRKIEDQKRLREEKEHKVAEAREIRLRNEQDLKNKINKKLEDKATVKEKLLEERCKEEKEKHKQRLKKQKDADERRKVEEEERQKKLLEQEKEAKIHAEFMQRKKDFEETERKRQIAEEKRKQEERLAELEQKRQEEIARIKQAEEEKDRERERIRLEKEKLIAVERAERERIEREKRDEKDKKIQEELDKLKAMEKERLRCQQEKLQQQKQEDAQQTAIRQMINKHNTSLTKQSSAVNLNTTQTSGNTSSSKINTYDMTPVKEKVFNMKNKNAESYDIDDKNSDDSTDDEEAPKKKIPEWATGIPLNTALIRQHMNPPDFETLFRTSCIEPPNLVLLFPGKKRQRYFQRTSSAIWNSPPLSKH